MHLHHQQNIVDLRHIQECDSLLHVAGRIFIAVTAKLSEPFEKAAPLSVQYRMERMIRVIYDRYQSAQSPPLQHCFKHLLFAANDRGSFPDLVPSLTEQGSQVF